MSDKIRFLKTLKERAEKKEGQFKPIDFHFLNPIKQSSSDSEILSIKPSSKKEDSQPVERIKAEKIFNPDLLPDHKLLKKQRVNKIRVNKLEMNLSSIENKFSLLNSKINNHRNDNRVATKDKVRERKVPADHKPDDKKDKKP